MQIFDTKLLKILLCAGIIGLVLAAMYVKGIKCFLITSNSMEPKISVGDVVVTYPHSEYAMGDIISYFDIKHFVTTHRVSSTKRIENKMFYFTKGDANHFEDKTPVHQREVIGKAILVVPYVGYAFKREVFGLVFYVPAGVLFGLKLNQFVLSSKHGDRTAP